MTIYGTRPEAIKMAPLISALQGHAHLEPVIAVTGQHREMLDQVNSLFDITPDHDLDLMRHGASITDLLSRALTSISALLADTAPDVVVVQGDTTSALAGALSAFYQKIPVVHLEAGLRTGNMSSPFPEEANRRLTAPISRLHLAPTATSRTNLENEGIDAGSIVVTGNTVIDALQRTTQLQVDFRDPAIAHVLASTRRILLVTAHRRESWGARMNESMSAIRRVGEANPDLQILLPMHRNSIVRDVISGVLGSLPNVTLTEPLSYLEFSHALSASHIVLTDSGGVQEEAPSLGKPVLVMRETTERPEAVHAGTVRLVGTDGETIFTELSRLLNDNDAYLEMANAVNPYGDGHAAPRAVAAISQMLGMGERLPDFDYGSAVKTEQAPFKRRLG